ncbi:hypothetical protein AB0O31_03285 [Kitasatospora cineracea]|uniref:hypothetical protein n=1 Tax=Kitasatospora cineracea TaxID=88074 RepID=UPI0034498C45
MSTTTLRVDTGTGELLPDQTPVPFSQFLEQHMAGRVHDDATAELHELIAAVTAHFKKGTLAIVITVEPSKGNVDGNPISIAATTVLKKPKGVTPSAPYYVDGEGNPTRNDPRQPPLFDGGAR